MLSVYGVEQNLKRNYLIGKQNKYFAQESVWVSGNQNLQ